MGDVNENYDPPVDRPRPATPNRGRPLSAAHVPEEPREGTAVAVTINFGGEGDHTYLWYRAVTGAWYVTGQSGARSWRALWQSMDGVRLVEAVELGRGRVLAW